MNNSEIIAGIYKKNNGFSPVTKEQFLSLVDEDPRVLCYILSYKIKKDVLTIVYNPHAPVYPGHIIVDHHDGFFTLYPSKNNEKQYVVSKYSDFANRFKGNVGSEIGVVSFAYFPFRCCDPRYKIYHVIPHFDTLHADMLENEFTSAQSKANEIARMLTANKSLPDVIKVFLAMNYIAQNYKYDYKAMLYITELNKQQKKLEIGEHHCNSAYGIFFEKKGVCGGFTHALNRILRSMNVEAKQITGTIKPTFFSAGGPHSWSAINIDGNWYHCDVTAAISSRNIFKYMLLTNQQIAGKYQWNDTLALCTTEYNTVKIKEWINQHRDELVAKGIERKYLWW